MTLRRRRSAGVCAESSSGRASARAAPAPRSSGCSASRRRARRLRAPNRGPEVAEQQHPKGAPRGQTRPAHHRRVEGGAGALDKRIELRLVEDAVHASIKGVRRTARQILRGHPHRRPRRTTPSLAHRHARQCSTRDRSCRSLTPRLPPRAARHATTAADRCAYRHFTQGLSRHWARRSENAPSPARKAVVPTRNTVLIVEVVVTMHELVVPLEYVS